ncbi:hypothetical protein [Falsiroseomonas tokyonensis]|uniref:Minor capsid protein n=1 Tax=Falsiroseomonas tokyonensis TaxID=430521 RepID=A0ABV7C4K5_9PROT|nr:hypothetical protein [Falsiroseomonas tokyonensis]MBU8542039.1 hypothetical protein [Falsiroseomonas tokyonensis]
MSGIELFALPAAIGGGSVTVGSALGVAGLLAGATRGASANNAQQRALYDNAQAQRQAGQNEIMAGEAEGARLQDDGRRRQAAAFNQAAGRGIDPSSGSEVDVAADLAGGSALDAEIARWRGRQAAVGRYDEANAMDRRARRLEASKLTDAGSTLLTSGARLYGTFEPRSEYIPPKYTKPERTTGRIAGPI